MQSVPYGQKTVAINLSVPSSRHAVNRVRVTKPSLSLPAVSKPRTLVLVGKTLGCRVLAVCLDALARLRPKQLPPQRMSYRAGRHRKTGRPRHVREQDELFAGFRSDGRADDSAPGNKEE